ncbi:hypothetical protein LIT25_20425 [Bacillus sp. F19]|nr:hypothetical protein LIT25_20425 [Bacillus sp. F19]
MNSEDVALFKYENHKFVLLAATAGFYQFNRIVKQQNRVEMHDREFELLILEEFLIVIKEEEKISFSKEFYDKLQSECDQFLSYFIRLFNKKESDAKHKSLSQLTEKLHSTMSKDEVLNQLIFSLQTMFPAYLFSFVKKALSKFIELSYDNECRKRRRREHGEGIQL